MKTLQVKKLSDKAILPARNINTDAGLDLFASEDIFIPTGSTVKISTDIAVNILPGYWGLVCDRSSMGAKGLRTGSGVIDAGYTGHLCIVMHNLNNKQTIENGTAYSYTRDQFGQMIPYYPDQQYGYQVHAGDKIAQLVIQPVSLPTVDEVSDLPETDRSNYGWGSSGR